MANQELYDKTYPVPSQIINFIKRVLISHPNSEGVKRANFIVKNGVLTYQSMKRLKNYFDTFNRETGDKIQYALAGGDLSITPNFEDMRGFIDRTLNSDRHAVASGKRVKLNMATNSNSELMSNNPTINENKKNDVNKNAVAIIVNADDKILLLKRADNSKIWMPNKWSLVGGAIEKGETPQQAIEREIMEETGLEIKKFIKTFTMNRNKGSVENFFACRYNGEPTDIKLNDENTNYGWYSISEIRYLDTVPHLIEYITITFKKYE